MSQQENNDQEFSQGLPGMPAAGSKPSGVGPEGLPDAFAGDGLGDKKKPAISSNTLLVMVLFVIAGGGLFVMNYTQMGITDAGKNVKHEKTVEKYLDQVSKEGANGSVKRINALGVSDKKIEVLHKLVSEDVTKHQVPLESLRKDPFHAKTTKKKSSKKRDAKQVELRDKLTKYAKQLKITGVLTGGAVPTAIINGKLFDQGAKVGPFTLVQITRKMKVVDGVKVAKRYIVLERKDYYGTKDYRITIPVREKKK